MNAPLTTAALGSTRCVGCEKRFAEAPGATVDVAGEEQQRNRYGGFSGPQSPRKVTRRWHQVCLSEFEAQNAAYRAQVEQDREEMLRSLCEGSGLDFEEMKAKYA